MISFADVANKIIDFVVNGTAKGQAYDRLALFTDTFGNRISGSKNLENAIGEYIAIKQLNFIITCVRRSLLFFVRSGHMHLCKFMTCLSV